MFGYNNNQNYIHKWSNSKKVDSYYRKFKNRIKEMELIFVEESSIYFNSTYRGGSPLQVIDLGCGDGMISRIFINNLMLPVESYLGVDLNKKNLESYSSVEFKTLNAKNKIVVRDDVNNIQLQEANIFLSFNSIYGIFPKTIKKAFKILPRKGIFLALVNSPKGIFSKLSDLGSCPLITSDSIIKIFDTIEGATIKTLDLSYEFPSVSKKEELDWTQYLLTQNFIIDEALDIYNSSPIEHETLLFIEKL